MKKWQIFKDIIGAYGTQKDIFLSLIDEEGIIQCANANMINTLHLKNPKETKINFFDLLHPVNLGHFKKALQLSVEDCSPYTMELHLKNGYYHPMKWQVNYLDNIAEDEKIYLCIGNKILDDERLKQFNRAGEENYQLIVEGLNTGILFQDVNGELIYANPKAAEIFTASLERLYKLKDIKQLWDAKWKVTTEQGERVAFENTPFVKALQTGKPQTDILVLHFINGENRWIHFNSQPLFQYDSKEPFSVVSNITDVTLEKNLSKQLNERETLFRFFLKQTPNLAWVVDEEAKLILASHSFYQYFGLNREKSINKKITDLVPDAVANALFEKHTGVLLTGIPAELVEKVKWADGTEFDFHINIFPIEGIQGKKMLGGHAVNLSDKYEAEKKIREANERLLLLTRATTDAIWEWDMQTGTIFLNDALMSMIGYQLENTKGLSWWLRRIHPDDRNRISDKVRETTEKSLQSWEDEYRFKCADRSYKHMRDKGYVVYENGLPVKMIGSLQDVSAMRDLENQLMEEKLERQKEISETVIRVQENERTRIGHELHDNVNQILSTVKLFVDMLKPAGKEEKEIKQKSIDYLMMAVEEIRKLSKDLVVPQLKNNGLTDSIRTLIDDIQMTNIINIKFTHDQESDLLSNGKKVTLFRIIQEQLKNILKHSGAKNATIHLHTQDGFIHLSIKDDGAGFDIKQTYRGIGLSNIFERTRFYNGNVNIETSVGNGCTMSVTISVL